MDKACGPKLLATFLAEHEISQSELARRLDVTRQVVWQWLEGTVRPSLDHAVDLEIQCAIPVASWLPKKNRRKMSRWA